MNLYEKTALVTGASRGIGAAIATRLAADGADITIGYAAAAHAAETVAGAVRAGGRRALAARAGVSRPEQVRRLFATAIEVSSNTTRLSLPGFAVYGASKLVGLHFVQVLAKELGPRWITVNAVSPGATRGAGVFTDSGDDDRTLLDLTGRTPLGRLGTPADTADVVAFLAGDQAGFITGRHLTVDGGAAIG